MKYDPKFILQRNIKNLFSVNGTLEDEQMFELISRLKSDASDATTQLSEITKMLVEAGLMKRNINSSIEALIEIANAPDTTQPQLSEIRYVLHGDIQPCSVLHSDDTTTLLRLDEGDMMCETDTIEWSDSVTYRCQELLKSVDVRSLGHVAPRLAQLVRDERILLNDNSDAALKANPNAETLEAIGKVFVEALGSKEIEQPCDECSHIFDAQSMTCPVCNTIRSSEHPTVVVPAPPPFPRGAADHNNPYVHTTTVFTEEAMRSHGWTDESLVSCGHGHYVPMQYPADMER